MSDIIFATPTTLLNRKITLSKLIFIFYFLRKYICMYTIYVQSIYKSPHAHIYVRTYIRIYCIYVHMYKFTASATPWKSV